MEQVADKLHQEYWRPAIENGIRPVLSESRTRVEVCSNCSTEFILGSRFCHVCGGERQSGTAKVRQWSEVLDFDNIRHALGFSAGSLVAFIFGMVCVLAAAGIGLIYNANTLVDWQAVQTWRIEWLLAAAVAFIAGILLKKPE